MHRSLSLFAVLALSTFAAAQEVAQEAEWIQNFTDAKAKAKAEKKHLLIDFTGSDWCGWCIKLDEEVFSKDEAFKNRSAQALRAGQARLPAQQGPRHRGDPARRTRNSVRSTRSRATRRSCCCDCEGRVYGPPATSTAARRSTTRTSPT
jgi:hypothetical protein